MLKRLLNEPLVHFLLLGLAIFLAYAVVRGDSGTGDDSIVIDDAVVSDIVQRYSSQWQRPPSAEELGGLIDNYIREEILYREGVALGLIEGDPVIRRRIRQKIDVLAEENAQDEPPSEADLLEWLKAHADRYRAPPVVSFSQVIFDPAKLGPRGESIITQAKAKLIAGADPANVGEITLLPLKVERGSLDQVAQDFGEEFAATIAKLPLDAWQGPVRSGYGLHLVRVTFRQDGRALKLAEARQEVARDWVSHKRDQAAKEYFSQLRSQYHVQVTAKLPAAAKPAEPKQ